MDASSHSSSSRGPGGARVYRRPNQAPQLATRVSPAWVLAGTLFLFGLGALFLTLLSRR